MNIKQKKITFGKLFRLLFRNRYLHIDFDSIVKELYLSKNTKSAKDLISNIEKLEENLSIAEYQIYLEPIFKQKINK